MFKSINKKKVIEVLKEYDEMVNAEFETIIEESEAGKLVRKPTDADRLGFLQDEWYKTLDKLEVLGIEL